MNQEQHFENILDRIVKNPKIFWFVSIVTFITIIFIIYDIMGRFYITAFLPNDKGQLDPYANFIHFIALTLTYILGLFSIVLLFSHIFGSQLGNITRRLSKNPMAIIGFVILMILMTCAIYADFIANYELVVIKQNLSRTFVHPGAGAILGTDEFGRDIFARIIHGTRISLSIGFISVLMSIIVGGFLGAVAGFYGGWLDNVLMRIMDVFLAIPSILLSIAIVSALGPNLINLVIALSVSSVPVYARIVRASVLSIRGQEFIEAAQAIGANNIYIILKYIIPNVMSPIIVQGTLGVAGAILSIAGLSFIGLGVQPPTPEWGSMLAGGRSFIRRASWVTTYPGIAIMISILSLNLLGDGLRDALDPRLK